MVKTVGDLKKAIADMPDDLLVEVYNDPSLLIDFVQAVQCDDDTDIPPVCVIFAETYKQE